MRKISFKTTFFHKNHEIKLKLTPCNHAESTREIRFQTKPFLKLVFLTTFGLMIRSNTVKAWQKPFLTEQWLKISS